jgi:hypothetical protein
MPEPREPRRRGRPRIVERGMRVCTWISERDFDQLSRVASQRHESVSSLIRRVVILRMSDFPPNK